MNRRGIRDRRSNGTLHGSVDPLFHHVVTSVTCLQAVYSYLGITLNGSNVSAWADQSGNGNDYTQGTAANQPAYTTGALNGLPIIDFDGSNDTLVSSVNVPIPGFIWHIIRQDTWTSADYLICDGSIATRIRLTQNPSTPQMRIGGASATQDVTPSFSNGTWGRVEMAFTNSTADYIKAGSTSATGTNLGNVASVGLKLGANNSGTAAGDCSLAALLVFNGVPNAGELSALSAAAQAIFGSGVAI